MVKNFPLEIVLVFGTPESFLVFTRVFFTVTLKDFVILLFRVTVTVVVPVFFPAVNLKVPLLFTDDTFTIAEFFEETLTT